MFYRPTHPQTGEMWDTWLYGHEGTYYLYYLARSDEAWDNISLAISPDALDWTEIGPILRKRPDATWMGTGSTWRSPTPGTRGAYVMNFSEWVGARQTIHFAVSDDLVHWERVDTRFEFVQDERWYARLGRWDCIWTLPRPGGGLYGYWTASPLPETRGRFGFGQSDDGISWEALPPPVVHGVGEGEVGAVGEIGDRYYMMFGAYPRMMTLVSDRPEGPFHIAAKNPALLGGDTYFSRFLAAPDGLLANHHSITRDGRVHLGLLKRAALDEHGTLRLAWWPGNDPLMQRGTAVVADVTATANAPVAMLPNAFDSAAGVVIECAIVLPQTAYAPRYGVYIECAPEWGVAILLDAQGRAELGRTDPAGSVWEPLHRVDREMAFGCPALLRIVLQNALMEAYLDDMLLLCAALPGPATGRIGLVRGGSSGAVSSVTLWRLAYRPGSRDVGQSVRRLLPPAPVAPLVGASERRRRHPRDDIAACLRTRKGAATYRTALHFRT
jgi:hypothetical protein